MTLDIGNGALVEKRGLVIPVRRVQRPLSDFTCVVLSLESGDSDTYPVRLEARGGTDVLIASSELYQESRQRAEFLSRFLHLPMSDATTGRGSPIPPEQVGRTFRDLAAVSAPEEDIARPATMRSRIATSGATTTISIPTRNSPVLPILGAALGFIATALIVPWMWRGFARSRAPFGISATFAGFVVLMLTLLPAASVLGSLIRAGRACCVATVSPDGLVVRRRQGWREEKSFIPPEDIWGIDYRGPDLNVESPALARAQG